MSWQKRLGRLKEFLNVVQGKIDPKQKLDWLFNPTDIRTGSRYSAQQCEFQMDARTAKDFYPEFSPLKELANHQGYVMISHKGLGREEGIKTQEKEGKQPFGIFQQLTGKNNGKEKKEKKVE